MPGMDRFAHRFFAGFRGQGLWGRLLSVAILALAAWVLGSWVGEWGDASASALAVQEGRYRTLGMLAAEYRALGTAAAAPTEAVDIPTAFAQVSERMELKERVNRISPDGRNQSVEINRLHAEELEDLIRGLAAQGVRFLSAEMRALPAGEKRLLSVSAIIGPMTEGPGR